MSRLHATLTLALAALIACALYFPGLSGGFLFDDYPNIVHNADVHLHGGAAADWWKAALSAPPNARPRPLAMLSFALNWCLTGDAPAPMKATNLALHVLNGLLLYLVLLALLRLRASAQAPAPENAARDRLLALLVSAAWLLAPINLSAVLYIVQRMESLAQLFVLLGLYGYLIGRERLLAAHDAPARRRGLALAAGSMVACLGLGLLAKETAALLPLYAFLAEIIVVRFRSPTLPARRVLQLLFAVFLFLPGVVGSIWLLLRELQSPVWSYRAFSLGERLLTEARVVVDYAIWSVLPSARSLTFFHDDVPVSHGLFAPPTTVAALLAIALALAAAFFLRRRKPLFALGVAWFLAAQLLTATIVPLELVHEHRNYFASIGAFLALFALLLDVRALREKSAAWVLPLLLIANFALVTRTRAVDWSDPVRFAVSAADRNPDSTRANYQAAQALIAAAQFQPSALLDAGLNYCRRAAALTGDSILPDQALIQVAQRAYHRAPEPQVWADLVAKLRARIPDDENIAALTALTHCAADGNCPDIRDDLARAFEAATQHEPVRGLLWDAYAGFAADVLHAPAQADALRKRSASAPFP